MEHMQDMAKGVAELDTDWNETKQILMEKTRKQLEDYNNEDKKDT